MWRKILAVLLIAMITFGLPAPAMASPGIGDVGKLVDRTMPRLLAKNKIPGAAVSVVADGKQVFAKGYGLADVERRTPVRADRTRFFTGSMAKSFTATAVLQLVAQGKLDLSADVNTYLKKFKIPDTYPGRPVTLHHLLTHTAGFADNVLGNSWEDPTDVASLEHIATEQLPDRVRPPGTVLAYDNYAHELAGYLVEVASGEPFDQYVQRHILKPLGMRGTTFAQPHPAALDTTLATGYRPDGDGYAPYKRYYGGAPSGVGPVTTVTDMSRFMIAQLDNDPRLGRDVPRRMQHRHYAQDSRVSGMGYGLQEWTRDGHRMLFKAGDVSGFHSLMVLIPGEDVGIYVTLNGEGISDGPADAQARKLVEQIVDRHFPGQDPSPRPIGGDTSTYAGEYTPARIRGDLLKFGTLFSPVTVESSGDGTITTTGLSGDPTAPEQEWVQTKPGLFDERGGPERISFNDQGVLSGTHAIEATSFEKQSGYASPFLHQILIEFGLVAFLLAFLAIPITALVRRLRGQRGQHRIAWWLAWVTSALALLFTAGLASLFIIDSNVAGDTIFLGSPMMTGMLLASSTAFVLTAGLVGYTVLAWIRRWWRLPGRLSYTLLTLGAGSFMTVAYVYHLVGGVFG